MGPNALIGSFSHGPEAVFFTFLITFGWPVAALWLIGQLPMCGFAERLAGRLLRLYWRILSWPFRWIGRQAWNLTGRGARAGARTTGRGALWLVRRAARGVWRGLRWAWRQLVYRARRAYHGRGWHP